MRLGMATKKKRCETRKLITQIKARCNYMLQKFKKLYG